MALFLLTTDDELENSVTDFQISQVNSFLAQFVFRFLPRVRYYYRRGTMDTILFLYRLCSSREIDSE